MMKRVELGRYGNAAASSQTRTAARSDWEMREYFEFY